MPKPEMTENCRLRNKIFMVMIFAASEPPQYIVVPLTGGKTRDMVRISQKIQNDQNYRSDRIFKEKANECYLLYIKGFITIHKLQIL